LPQLPTTTVRTGRHGSTRPSTTRVMPDLGAVSARNTPANPAGPSTRVARRP
jgi:hypothetical protein